MVYTSDCLSKDFAHVQNFQFRTPLLVILLGHGVCHNDLIQCARIDALYGVTAQDSVSDESYYISGALFLQQLGRSSDGVRSIRQIVDKEALSVPDLSNQHHSRILSVIYLGRATLLVDKRKWHAQRICNCRSSLRSSGIRTHNHCVLVIGDQLNVLPEHMATVEIVHGYVKKTLILRVMKIHCDDMVCARASKKIGNQGTRLRDPLLVAGLRFEWREFDRDSAIIVVGSIRTVGAVRSEVRSEITSVFRFLGVKSVGALDRTDGVGGAVPILGKFDALQLLVQGCGTIGEARARLLTWVWCLGHTLESKGALAAVRLCRGLDKRRACLVVGDIALAGVREQREDGGDALCGGCSAGGDADQLDWGLGGAFRRVLASLPAPSSCH